MRDSYYNIVSHSLQFSQDILSVQLVRQQYNKYEGFSEVT